MKRGRLMAVVLALGIAALVGRDGYRMAVAYREHRAVEQRLPHLPQVHSDTSRRAVDFPVKVWLHRVNSIERAVLMAREYRGLEIDVVYDSSAGYFDVGHPPVASAGISLERLIAAVPDITDHYFWIDFKNLSESNAQAACGVLLAMARKYDILGNMIVESTNPRALACFTAGGVYTSYYLFPDTSLQGMDPGQVARYYEEVKANLAASNVDALSSSYRSLPFIDAYFPGIDLLLWYLEPNKSLRYHAGLAYLQRKSRVKVVLVSEGSRGFR
jgi:heptose-I-phosphate ethanolaminephosphotransferase